MSYLTFKCLFLLIKQEKMITNINSSNVGHEHKRSNFSSKMGKKTSSLLQIISKSILICMSLFYLTFGIGFSSAVLYHFDKSQGDCSNPQLYSHHPELQLWNGVKLKVS